MHLASRIIGPGELNYAFYTLALRYIDRAGLSYKTLNEVHGVFDCCNKELYRRVTATYEDEKIDENGDVLID